MNLARWARKFPFAIGGSQCPECGGWLTEDYVRDPVTQSHWRGVRALVCENDDCDYAERLEE